LRKHILFTENKTRKLPDDNLTLFVNSVSIKRVEICKFFGVYVNKLQTIYTY